MDHIKDTALPSKIYNKLGEREGYEGRYTQFKIQNLKKKKKKLS